MPLRSDGSSPPSEIPENEDLDSFIVLGTCVAIAADDKSEDPIWFVKVTESV